MIQIYLILIVDIERETKVTYTIDQLEERLKQLVEKNYIKKQETIFGHMYKSL